MLKKMMTTGVLVLIGMGLWCRHGFGFGLGSDFCGCEGGKIEARQAIHSNFRNVITTKMRMIQPAKY